MAMTSTLQHYDHDDIILKTSQDYHLGSLSTIKTTVWVKFCISNIHQAFFLALAAGVKRWSPLQPLNSHGMCMAPCHVTTLFLIIGCSSFCGPSPHILCTKRPSWPQLDEYSTRQVAIYVLSNNQVINTQVYRVGLTGPWYQGNRWQGCPSRNRVHII